MSVDNSSASIGVSEFGIYDYSLTEVLKSFLKIACFLIRPSSAVVSIGVFRIKVYSLIKVNDSACMVFQFLV